MQKLLETFLIGLSTGSIYALMSIALVLVWRSTRVVNFAQAGQAMLSTYIGFEIATRTEIFWLGLLFAIAAGALLGAGVDYFFMRVLFKHAVSGPAAVVAPVIATLGLLGLVRSDYRDGFRNSHCSSNHFSTHESGPIFACISLCTRDCAVSWNQDGANKDYWLGNCWWSWWSRWNVKYCF